ncbi:hypothetical protein GOBAR_AA27792 [Gossypium barbadense]|uniref:Uncharacterized protein n=1 Tax=Gossypium barbadense TaxID=3634 RepID=A0A2P5WP61_GOSBA|nr:hypothetical protein GOBAR_AA27792 [Gossypium barbadense]
MTGQERILAFTRSPLNLNYTGGLRLRWYLRFVVEALRLTSFASKEYVTAYIRSTTSYTKKLSTVKICKSIYPIPGHRNSPSYEPAYLETGSGFKGEIPQSG